MTQSILNQFKALCDRRDLAAYAVVGSLNSAMCACRKGEAAVALEILSDARTRYELADTELENFKRLHLQTISKKENSINGNRSAAA